MIISLIVVIFIFAFNPLSSLFLLAFSVPIINWLFYFKNLEIPLADLIAVLGLIAWFLALLYKLIFQKNVKVKLKFPLFFPFFLFLLANILSLFNHPAPLTGFYYLSRWLILLYAAYIFLPINLLKKEKHLRLIVWGLALSSLIVMMSGWLSLLTQDWQNSFFRLKSISWWGIYPFGENHNLIAEFLNAGAFLWLALKEWASSTRKKRIYNSIFLITVAAVILTFSRAAWITLALQLSVYLLWHNRQHLKKQGGLILLTAVAAILIMLPIFWRMNVLQADNISSTENRLLLLDIAYQAWQEKPILGQGTGRFTELVADNIRFSAKYGDPIDSHGFLQKIAAETGLIGLISWIFLLIIIAQQAMIGLKKYSRQAPWLTPIWIAASGGIFFQIFNTSYYKGKVWLFIALALVATELAKQKYGRKN